VHHGRPAKHHSKSGHPATAKLLEGGHPAVTSTAPATVALAPGTASLVWLEVEVNGQQPGTSLLLQTPDGRLWAPAEDLRLWRLPIPPGEPLINNGGAYYALDRLPGLHYTIDDATQSVTISAPARLFAETVIDQARARGAKPDPARPGGFLNYDLIAARMPGAAAEMTTSIGGQLEVGMFNRWGVGTTTFVRPVAITDESLIRLDTTWTQDRPDQLASLRFGDSISGTSSWSGAVHFAGVQWSTDFSTQPSFVTTPLAGIHGEAVLPSTIDLYIDDALRLQTSVPPGPFSINNLPVISGQGTAQIVVRDVLGQQQLITVPYYASPSLLRPGLSSFSYEVGAARDNYGLSSNDYGRSLAVGTERYGFSDTFTGEVHAEVLPDQQTVGVSGVWLAHSSVVLNVAVATSHSSRGDAPLLQLGVDRESHTFSFGASARFAAEGYVQLGMLPSELAPVRVLQGYFSFPTPARGSVGVNYIQEDYRDQAPAHIVSTQASWPVSHDGFLSFTAMKPLRGGNPGSGATVGINLIFSLGERRSVSTTESRQGGAGQEQVQMQQNLPAGRGLGYRVAVGMGPADPWDATLSYQTDFGTYTLRSTRDDNQTGYSAEAQGGVAVLDDDFFLSRRINQSFAVVRVGDYPNVRVYADNQEVAVTDSSGEALVPHIRAYERNPVSIEQADLPLDAEFGALEKDAIPNRRSGVLVNFDAKPSQGALLVLVQEDGTPVPAGAVAHLAGNAEDFPVGMRGETYVTGLSKSIPVRVTWPSLECEAMVEFVPSADPLPKLGPIICRSVQQ
jgi:outer membrane usher protein